VVPRWIENLGWRVVDRRALAAVALAGSLALSVNVSLARAPPGSGRDAGRIDRALRPVAAVLRPSDRVALLVPADDPTGWYAGDARAGWYATQYSLAPAIVIPVREGLLDGPDAARYLEGATHLLVPNRPMDRAAALGAPLGFLPVAEGRGGTLLARRSP
jgi:hypothetical protein